MTGQGFTWVSDPRGPLHSGSGNQYVYQWSIGPESQLLRRGTARREIVREHRLRLTRCYVRPRGYARAAERLEPPGAVVLLDGAAGSGRRATATMLLEEAPEPDGGIEELPLASEDGFSEPSPGRRYLLDLSRVDDTEYPSVQKTLAQYRTMVEKNDARMVVVAPAGLEWMLDAELAPLVVRIERPRGRAVLGRHLRVRGVEFTHEQLTTDDLGRLCETAPMRELDRLADLVAQARDSARYGTDFVRWRDAALSASTNWSQQVARQLREHPGARERALLLAAAMLHGAPAETVLEAAGVLLEVLRHPEDGAPGLAGEGLGERFDKLALLREDDGRVGFSGLAYDGAVRKHFWENFPEIRPEFRDWVGLCVARRGIASEERGRLAARFAEQALAAGRPDDLPLLVEAWTRPVEGGRLRAEAAVLLELGLSHEQYGPWFRNRVYQWVKASKLDPDLARVLTDVCRYVLSVTHPEQAMVRLRYLALNGEAPEDAVRAARTALLGLAAGSRRQYRRLVHRLLVSTAGERLLDVLVGLVDPVGLRIEPPWEEFALVWRAVMARGTPGSWTPLVKRWLTAVAERRVSDQVLVALLLAASGDRMLLDQLYATACDWVGETPAAEARARTARGFCQEIDTALGIGMVLSGSGARVNRDGE
ncbi:hypothetical protein ACIQRS_30090 [Streptomyces termitum]|uniref:Uncharacterized protein n=1 Tax=Streptomyces termitum TaxID=67368 RepID=A0A918T8I9_9ACTN|nr:hypothetical protein [Streptomyces termitum]GHB06105.1 hypothetical protein GCM10010305_56670 [Streptomyces termitum]